MKNDLREIFRSFLKNWKTTFIAVVIAVLMAMRFAGKVSTDEIVTIIGALVALGFTVSKDSNK